MQVKVGQKIKCVKTFFTDFLKDKEYEVNWVALNEAAVCGEGRSIIWFKFPDLDTYFEELSYLGPIIFNDPWASLIPTKVKKSLLEGKDPNCDCGFVPRQSAKHYEWCKTLANVMSA